MSNSRGGAKTRTKSAKRTQATPYKHPEAKSLMRPEIGTQAQFKKKKPPKTYRYDSSLSPALDWAGKAERLSFQVPTLPLFLHERLSTKAIVETLRGHKRQQAEQLDLLDHLFADPKHSISDQVLKAVDYVVKYRQWDERPASPSAVVRFNRNGEVQFLRK